MLGFRLPKPRRFHYEPLYWNPEKEEREAHRIHFKRTYRHRTSQQRSILWLAILLGLVLYLLHFLSRLTP